MRAPGLRWRRRSRGAAPVVALNRTLVAETEAILKEEGAAAATTGVAVDLESVAPVDAAVAELKRRRITVDRLVLNAGMLPIVAATGDGADVMLQVNVLSSARLVEMMRSTGVLSQTRAADGGLPRIVFVGSEAHRSSAPLNLDDLARTRRWEYGVGGVVKFYGHTKLYLHTWAAQLARELEGKADVLHLCPAPSPEHRREGPCGASPSSRASCGSRSSRPPPPPSPSAGAPPTRRPPAATACTCTSAASAPRAPLPPTPRRGSSCGRPSASCSSASKKRAPPRVAYFRDLIFF